MNIKLRKIVDSDKETYFNLTKEVWINKKILQEKSQVDTLWKIMFSGQEIYYAILKDNQTCGFCSIMHMDQEIQEISIELFRAFQNQGIGYMALKLLLEICEKDYHMQKIQSKVYPDNFPSILLMRKVGASPCKIEKNTCIDASSEVNFQKNNLNLLSENICKVAKIFCVPPKFLLSNILVFEIMLPIAESQFDISLTGNLDYEKKIETQAMHFMLMQRKLSLERLLEECKDNISDETKDTFSSLISKYDLK